MIRTEIESELIDINAAWNKAFKAGRSDEARRLSERRIELQSALVSAPKNESCTATTPYIPTERQRVVDLPRSGGPSWLFNDASLKHTTDLALSADAMDAVIANRERLRGVK